jgi:predicted DNA-binding transcriptional regulator AlpA
MPADLPSAHPPKNHLPLVPLLAAGCQAAPFSREAAKSSCKHTVFHGNVHLYSTGKKKFNLNHRQGIMAAVPHNLLADPLLTVQDVARLFKVSRRTIWRWVAEGRLPEPIRYSRLCVRWPSSVIRPYLENFPLPPGR